MRIEPNVMALYVQDLARSSLFYQDLLGKKPTEASPTFHSFILSNGMILALKAQHSVVPPSEVKSGNTELACTVESLQKVDELFAACQSKKITIIFPPAQVPFGYTFVALDPDGHRLRVASIAK